MLRKTLAAVAALAIVSGGITLGQPSQPERRDRPTRRQRQRQPLPAPDHADLSYGPHERNVLDVWVVESDEPTPLVIYIHGGGFRAGDKRSLNSMVLRRCRDLGISVAAINYRYSTQAPFPAPMHDAARAVQYLRLHAERFNIDTDRVAAFGGSAGAGISMWLAYHDDLADPDAEDPLLRESTRLTAAGANAGQTTYDPFVMRDLFDGADAPGHLPMRLFYGAESSEDLRRPEMRELAHEASPINHVSPDDPPVFMFYNRPDTPVTQSTPDNVWVHHPRFGQFLRKELDRLQLHYVLDVRAQERIASEGIRPGPWSMIDLFAFEFGLDVPEPAPVRARSRPGG